MSLPVMIVAALIQQVLILQVASTGLAPGLCLVAANLLRVIRHLRA